MTPFKPSFIIAVALGFAINQPLLAQPPYSESYALTVGTYASIFNPPTPEQKKEEELQAWRQWHTVENYAFGKDRGSLPIVADLRSLHPYFRDKIEKLITRCESKGIKLAIVEAYRTPAKQNEYRSMGAKYTRSKGGFSKHQYGLAIDVVPIVNTKAVWDNKMLWKRIGTIGESLGLTWGGRWRTPYDPGHFEWSGGLTATQLQKGVMPVVPQKQQYPCIDEDLQMLAEQWKAWAIEQSTYSRSGASAKVLK